MGADNSSSVATEIVIHIDRSQFQLARQRLTGRDLRQLPRPPIPPDRDLFVARGDGNDDELIPDERAIELVDGLQFFTVPRTIVAGAAPNVRC